MPSPNQVNWGPGQAGETRAALLIAADGGLGAAASLRDAAGFDLVAAETVSGLVGLILAGGIDAVVLDPELGDGWPVDVAEQVTKSLRAIVPIMIVCRSREDAEQIEHRVGAGNARILLTERCGGGELATSLKGHIAAQRGRAARV